MAAPVLFHHPSSLEHETGLHPERPARIAAVRRALELRDWLGWDVRESPEATLEQLQAIHSPRHVAAIERLSAQGGGAIDADTLVSPGSYRAALHAAGGAVALVDALLGPDEARVGASLHRPPGHHAEPARAMGFCLFNNVAVAARHALDAHGVGRVLVLDWDVHHGNGTNDAFHAAPEVLFVSIHESPLYPGTGPAEDVGSGLGTGYTVNIPVPAGSGDAAWTSLVEHVAVPLAEAYAPGLVLVSAGFDAHADDPLAGCLVTEEGFAAMAGSVRRVADRLGVPLGIMLEGGYDLAALASSLVAVLEAVGTPVAPPAPEPEETALHPLAERARERLAGRWPVLGGAPRATG
jgi:acetoin utilization deacetylase AcuC-like enzyme